MFGLLVGTGGPVSAHSGEGGMGCKFWLGGELRRFFAECEGGLDMSIVLFIGASR